MTLKSISYRKQATVSLSHWCRNQCSYCSFYHKDNEVTDKAEVTNQLKAIKKKGVRNVQFMSGECPDSNGIIKDLLKSEGYNSFGNYLLSLCRIAIKLGMVPAINVGYLQAADLKKFKGLISNMEISLENTSDRLTKNGLPHYNSPGKMPEARLGLLRSAGEQKIPITTGLLVGIGETRRERYRTLEDIKVIQNKYKNIQLVFIRSCCIEESEGMRGTDISLITDTIRYAKAVMPDMPLQVSANQIMPYWKEVIGLGVSDFGCRPLNGDLLMPGFKWPNVKKLSLEVEDLDVRLVEESVIGDDFMNSKWYSAELLKNIRRGQRVSPTHLSSNG